MHMFLIGHFSLPIDCIAAPINLIINSYLSSYVDGILQLFGYCRKYNKTWLHVEK